MMQEPSLIDEAVEYGIVSECFIPSRRRIFDYIYSRYNSGKSFDLLSIRQHFKDANELENVGGEAKIVEIYSFAASATAHFEPHCKIVVDKYKLRSLISKCEEVAEKCYENPEDVDHFIDESEAVLLSVGNSRKNDNIQTSDSLIDKTLSNFESFVRGSKQIEGLPTRFSVFNDLTRGLLPQNMIVIAARPSMGKTAWMCNVVEDLTFDGHAGMVFSCEMSAEQLMDRIIYGRARFPMHYLKKGFTPTRDEIERLKRAFGDMTKKELFIDDTAGIGIDEVRSKLRRKKKEFDIKYAAVDYLQLMTGHDKKNREREIAEISAGLKGISKELNIPVIALAQLNRNAEKRQDGVPKMSDLRESGAVEADADIVGLLYRADYYRDEDDEEKDSNGSNSSLIIAKNRNGPTGEVSMRFEKEIMRFS